MYQCTNCSGPIIKWLYFSSAKYPVLLSSMHYHLGTVGVSAYAVDALGEIAYVELPDPGASVTAGEVNYWFTDIRHRIVFMEELSQRPYTIK